VHHTIAKEVMHGADPAVVAYVGNRAVGEFMKRRVFIPGRTLSWNQLTKHATGEELSPRAFAEDFRAK
jgi:peptidyl-dipeptidase A